MNSSSSIDATSEPVLLNKENLQFVAAQSICLDRLVFDRRALPDGFQLQGPVALFQQPDIQPAAEPIIINKQVLAQAAIPEQSANQITGLEIVPWQPVGSAVALHILADFIDFRQRARRVQPEVHTESQGSGSQEMISMGLASFGTEFDFENPTIQHSSTKPSWSGVSSSSTVHRPHSRTPLVDSSVRRSPRIRGDQGGFKHVHLDKR